MSQPSGKPVDAAIIHLQENRIKEMLEDPLGYETEDAAGVPVFVKSKSFGFFQAWKLAPATLIPKVFIFTRSRNVLVELLWHRQWREPSYRFIDNRPPQGWQNEGLLALADLMARQSLLELKEECEYGDWEKAFFPGLSFNNLVSPDNEELQKTLAGRSADYDFLIAYGKRGKRGLRDNLFVITRVAHAWDNFYVPLRYFTDEAALSFVKEIIGYEADLSAYRKVIRGTDGGLQLKPPSPAVVTRWIADHKGTKTGGQVVLSLQHAKKAGLDLSRIKEDFGRDFPLKRIVIQ